MNKKMRELMDAMKAKREEAAKYNGGDEKDLDKAASLLDEADELQKEYDNEKRLFEAGKAEIPVDAAAKAVEKAGKGGYDQAVKSFASAIRSCFKSLNEGTASAGGYTVPEEIATKIIELRKAKRSAIDLVDYAVKKTLSGEETYQKRSNVAGFSKVGEGGKIPATGAPEFGRIAWKIDKYAGYMPVTNELLEDSDENIVGIVNEWFAENSRVTGNKLVFATLDERYSKEGAPLPLTIDSIDDIKYALNVVLGQAFKPTSTIVTNDDGLQWLDTLKDNDGNYLLKGNPQDPLAMRLSAGATTVPVDVFPNSDLPTDEANGIPFYIGDLKESAKYYDRKHLSLEASRVAAIGGLNAWEEDLTVYRGIEREDVELKDDEAFVKGYVATGSESGTKITSFAIGSAVGAIDETGKAIAVEVANGTEVTALVATFETNGETVKVGNKVQVSGTTANDFTAPKNYKVTSKNGDSATYAVTVTVASA